MEGLRLIMNLSTLYISVPEYIEFGWVTAPNAAGQSITANTITTLTLDTEVSDTGNLVSAPSSNQFTLPAGTYYFDVSAPLGSTSSGATGLVGLYNATASAWVSRERFSVSNYALQATLTHVTGQFVITGNTMFDVRAVISVAGRNGNGALAMTDMTLATAGTDQRTTIKLWRLK